MSEMQTRNLFKKYERFVLKRAIEQFTQVSYRADQVKLNLGIPKLPLSSTLCMETLISCDVRNKFFSSGNGLNRMVMAFENGQFCPTLNLPGPSLNGTSAVTSHRGHALC